MLPPLFFTVNFPTRLAVFWRTHISRKVMPSASRMEPRTFLIFRLDALGDVVMTTPLFRALKTAHPKSRCTVVVQKAYKSLLSTNPYIDEILTLPSVRPAWLPLGLRRLISALLLYWRSLRKRSFDFAISPRWDADEHLATFLCVLTHAAARIGYSEAASAMKARMNRGFDAAYDICLPPGATTHEVLRNVAVAEALGATACDIRLELRVTEQDCKHAARLLAKVPRSAELIALGIGAKSRSRRWPLERYADVVNRIAAGRQIWPIIVCAGSEFGDAIKLAGLLRQPPVILSGAPLRQVCAVLERCELFIGNDSGVAHLAAAMDCKVIVLSRHPRSGDPNHFNSPIRFAPLGNEVRVLQPPGMEGCHDACRSPLPHCITQISAEEVAAAGEELLKSRRDEAAGLSTNDLVETYSHPLLTAHDLTGIESALEALRSDLPRPFA